MNRRQSVKGPAGAAGNTMFAATRLALRLVRNGLRCRYLRISGKPGGPQAVSLEVTRRCVCHCVMCNIWRVKQREPELSLDEWLGLLSAPALADVRELDVTGGEPFLWDDLVSLVTAVCGLKESRLKQLRSMAITTNGVLVDRVAPGVEEMLGVMSRCGLELVVVCALDAVGPLHDEIRRYPGAWPTAQKTIAALMELRSKWPNLVVGLKTTVLPMNIDELEGIAAYARDRDLFTIISPAIVTPGRYLNVDRAADLQLSPAQRLRLAEFYEGGYSEWTYHARTVAGYLRTGRIKRPCTCGFNYFFVRSNGDVYLCPLIDEAVGNLRDTPVETLLASDRARRIRGLVGRTQQCAQCTEPGLERYSLPYQGFAYLRECFRVGPRRFLALHEHLGLDKYV